MAILNTVEVMNKPVGGSDTLSHLELALRQVGVEDARAFSSLYYTLADGGIDTSKLEQAADLVHHDVTQETFLNTPLETDRSWDFAIHVEYKPGVTDNAARVLKTDLGLIDLQDTDVYTSVVHYVSGKFDESLEDQLERLASNPLIHDITITKKDDFMAQGGFERKIHPVALEDRPNTFWIDVGGMDNDELGRTGSLGTLNTDLTINPKQKRGGELALGMDYMNVIQTYSTSSLNTSVAGREKGFLTDTEVELIAQMWSEHCRHSLFNASFTINGERFEKGIFDAYIRQPSEKVLAGKPHLGVSIYKDNSGVFEFDDFWNILIKNETHNSPSALDPFGGAITGIVGVNRDPCGTGIGGEVIGNFLFYYFGHLDDKRKYYKSRLGLVDNEWRKEGEIRELKLENRVDEWKVDPSSLMLNPKQIYDGVNKGVEEGGNKMGISLNLGTSIYSTNYNGKPIVGVGSFGRMPKVINDVLSHKKEIDVGDRVYILGGRAGRDGIHGATFSSKGITASSPPTAVQIGDPYTQHKMFQAILELRDKGYIKFITDLGAGGVCCATMEMAEETGGLELDLDKLLVKYPGMTATEILMNESQERMAIAIDETKASEIEEILEKHEVDFSDIGVFTDSGRAVVKSKGEDVVNLDMNFIHKGMPQRSLNPIEYRLGDVEVAGMQRKMDESMALAWGEWGLNTSTDRLSEEFYQMVRRPNLGSHASFLDRMDDSVKALSVQHCIQGKGCISTKSACTRVTLDSDAGLVQAYGHAERQSYIDSKKMGKNAFLRSIGNNIAMGGRLNHMVATDQALWQSSDDGKYQQMLIETFQGMADFVEGVAVASHEAEINVLGGESAEMEGTYNQGQMDGFVHVLSLCEDSGVCDIADLINDMKQPRLVGSTDGTGTKTKIVRSPEDIVYHGFNDIGALGVKPIAFALYVAGNVSKEELESIDRAADVIAKQLGIAKAGSMVTRKPGTYQEGEVDIAATMVGVIDQDKLITGAGVKPGYSIIGVSVDGLMTNGYTLARDIAGRLIEEGEVQGWDDPLKALGNKSLKEVLSLPHRPMTDILFGNDDSKGILDIYGSYIAGTAHITGGGQLDNIPRMVPDDCKAVIMKDVLPVPAFMQLARDRKLPQEELYKTFNMGPGFTLTVPSDMAHKIVNYINTNFRDNAGYTRSAAVIGKIVERDSQVELI